MGETEISSVSSIPSAAMEQAGERDMYVGVLRVYMVEPESRWSACGPIKNGFIGFAYETDVVLFDDEVYTIDFTWDAAVTGLLNIQPSNLKVIAVLFSGASYGTGYSEPPDGHPFAIYPSDATAWATLAEQQFNRITDSFTHTVFAEEGTEAGGG
jgi:hypothetical protein